MSAASSRPQAEPMRTWDETAVPVDRPRWCGGAAVYVTRDEYREMERLGWRFVTRSADVPHDRRDFARVSCTDEVMTRGDYLYGVCSKCAALEADNRAMHKAAGGGRR